MTSIAGRELLLKRGWCPAASVVAEAQAQAGSGTEVPMSSTGRGRTGREHQAGDDSDPIAGRTANAPGLRRSIA
jgi:hypothetical protein